MSVLNENDLFLAKILELKEGLNTMGVSMGKNSKGSHYLVSKLKFNKSF